MAGWVVIYSSSLSSPHSGLLLYGYSSGRGESEPTVKTIYMRSSLWVSSLLPQPQCMPGKRKTSRSAPRSAAVFALRPVRVVASEPVSQRAARRNPEPVEPTRNLEPIRPRRQYRFLSGRWVHASECVWKLGNRVPRLGEEGKPGRLRKGRGGMGVKKGAGWGRGRARGLGFFTSLRPRKPVGPEGARGGRTYCQRFFSLHCCPLSLFLSRASTVNRLRSFWALRLPPNDRCAPGEPFSEALF